MKIAHICLCGPFTEGMTYQENLLSLQNALDGHDVLIIASKYSWDKNKIIKVPECNKLIQHNLRLVRIDYDKVFNEFLTAKLRKASRLMPIVEEFNPDIIFFHNPQSYELMNIARYKRHHKNKILIVDNHSDFTNSASNCISYFVLHRIVYKSFLKFSKEYIDKMYTIGADAYRFIKKAYNYDRNNIEMFPLGCFIINFSEQEKDLLRKQYNISDGEIVMVHTGKIDERKMTKELLELFNKGGYANIKLLIIGIIDEEYSTKVMPLIEENPRVLYLGWKNGVELMKCLSLSDVYVQPGSPSATLQQAIGYGNAIIARDLDVYRSVVKNNGWLVSSVEQISQILAYIDNNPQILAKMKDESRRIAESLLSYTGLARKIYQLADVKSI